MSNERLNESEQGIKYGYVQKFRLFFECSKYERARTLAVLRFIPGLKQARWKLFLP